MVCMAGPPAEAGALPAFCYFALNGYDSLHLDPYNQPVQALKELPIRAFSWDIPFHNRATDPVDSLKRWNGEFAHGNDFITPFVEESAQKIEALIAEGLIDPHRICLSGLSRGGFIALHLAKRLPQVKYVVVFAPLTDLHSFVGENPFPGEIHRRLNLIESLAPFLHKKIRIYIGNLDERVNTDAAYRFVRALAKKAHAERMRHFEYEMYVTPSIGHLGHGTTKEIFTQGALWGFKHVTK